MTTILILSKLNKNLELVAEFFKKQGFDSVSASSYEDLDRILSSLSFDIALLDIGGFDSKIWHYCEKINNYGKPFFIISSVKNPKIDKEGIKKGARGVLVKPLVMKELNEIIKALV
ncbi:Two-component system response regulator OmpR [Thermodesulfovibrio sp. N1]|uniref:response regulator transcription factor n=1 Tax=Thermodesulfovibrio sp. N1 TaxID=1871110 RepID=UPI00083B6CFE|nr:response regulator transcription factor [Thermodesulfovibrio sp. N1]ODA43904.1 Two-component system response regulator OmpR [Thermodesulfovibrio sp. N1]